METAKKVIIKMYTIHCNELSIPPHLCEYRVPQMEYNAPRFNKLSAFNLYTKKNLPESKVHGNPESGVLNSRILSPWTPDSGIQALRIWSPGPGKGVRRPYRIF